MKYLIVVFLGILIFSGCEKKNTVEVVPDYDSIYLTSDNVDVKAQLVDGDENKLTQDIMKEMTKNSLDKISLKYKFYLDQNGDVQKIQAVHTPGKDYTNLIASEIGSWKFEPALKDGKKVKSQYNWVLNIPPGKSIDAGDYKVIVETMPAPVGGMKSLQQNIVYPEDAKLKGIEGKVIVQAFIDESGKVVKTEILKSAGDDLDKAAVKALQNTAFTPGKADGKPVKVKIVIPIVFKLK